MKVIGAKMISAIILAAGLSSRMGAAKQLLKLGEQPIIRVVTKNVLASRVGEVIVVTGHRAEEVGAEICDLPVRIVFNPGYARGQGSSLVAGAKAVSSKALGFIIFMCDQPLITAPLIDHIIENFVNCNCSAMRPTYQGVPGHPVALGRSLLTELVSLNGDEGARKILARLGDQVCYLPVDDDAVILDADTPEDLEGIRRRLV